MKYTVGFLFRRTNGWLDDKVLLIHKLHGPEYVVDKLNGIGGKVEEGETPLQGMIREGQEEGNIYLGDNDVMWEQFHYELHPGTSLKPEPKELHFFAAAASYQTFRNIRSLTEEKVTWAYTPAALQRMKAVVREGPDYQLADAGPLKELVPNLVYLLPMARHWLQTGADYSTQEPCRACAEQGWIE